MHSLIQDLFSLGFCGCEGTTYQETEMRSGKSYTRTIRMADALSIAAQLLKAPSNRKLLEEGRRLVRLSKWHRTGMDGELMEDDAD